MKEVDRFQKTYQKNLRPLFTKLGFSSENSKNTWFLSITELQNTFNTKDHNIDNNQIKNIPKSLEKYLLKDDGQNKSIDLNRYEYWLYRQIQEKVSSGVLYIEDSKLNKCFNHELVSLEEKDKILKGLDIPWLRESAEKQVQDLLIVLDGLWKTINQKYEQGELKHLRYDEKKQKFIWNKIRAINNDKLQDDFYSQLPFCEINDVMRFVDQETDFLSAFTPLQPRYAKKGIVSKDRLIASILSKALNYGDYKMSQASDISYKALEATSAQALRLSTLRKANDIICNKIAKLSIFPYYSIDLALLFSSVDGQKYELNVPNAKARFSEKHLREKPGLSAYTILANNVPFNCYLIGSHEHESHHVFDIWYNNTSDIMPQVITGDMHSINKANFALLRWFGRQFKPRFTSLNTQLSNIYGSQNTDYKNYFLKPAGLIDSQVIIEQKGKIDQIVATLALKEINQANLIKKLCHLPPENSLRKAVFEFDKLIRSIYTLEYMMDVKLQRDVLKSQNRIEAYHQLRAAIAKVGGGKKKLYGQTDIDIEISNQCGRLAANNAIYYNSVILSWLIENNPHLKDNKKFLKMIKKISPIAWSHIHFLGQYTFKNKGESIDLAKILKNIKLKF